MPVREREVLTTPLTADRIERRAAEGWRLRVVEWERAEVETAPGAMIEGTPYGLRVAGDCHRLEPDPAEVETMMTIMEGVVEDAPMSRIAGDLNRRGMRTRDGRPWTEVAVFNLLPRLIEFSPRFLSTPEWQRRRSRLQLAG